MGGKQKVMRQAGSGACNTGMALMIPNLSERQQGAGGANLQRRAT